MRRVAVPRDLPPAIALPPRARVAALGGEAMGTGWTVKWVPLRADADTEAVRRRIGEALDQVVRQMSPWIAESDISAFNRAAAGAWHRLPDAFRTVLTRALEIARASGGAYDPTIGELVDLWGFGPPGPRERDPDDNAIAAALGRCGWHRLAVDGRGHVRQPGGLRLDLSSIAKGFAVDLVVERLAASGIGSLLVEIGGELRGHGVKPDGSPWWVALEGHDMIDPARGRTPVADLVALFDLAVATSGDSQRRVERGGRLLSHTIDPRTGRPVADRVACVTVLHRRCMDADAWATALLALGPDAGPATAEREGLAARFVMRDGAALREHVSPALAAMLDDAA